MDTREFGEKRIIELMSNESEYGDDESALFLLWRKLLGRGLVSRELAENRKFSEKDLKTIMEIVRENENDFKAKFKAHIG
jgi:hypothetical protein